MKRKSLIAIVAISIMCFIILVLGALLLIVAINSNNQINNLQQQINTTTTNTDSTVKWTVTSKKDTEETSVYKVDVTYPFLENAEVPAVASDVNDYINSSILVYRKETTLSDPSVSSAKNSLSLNYKVYFLSNNVVSILISGNVYSGGAHPNGLYFSINYDLKNNQPLNIYNVFNSSSDYLHTFSVNSKTALEATLGTDESSETMITGGTGEDNNNFQVFNFKGTDKVTNIVVTFPQYQVAPYAMGPQTVELNVDDFSSYFNSEVSALL